MPVGKSKFSEGEKVLCYHGSVIYEAKCLRIDKEKELKYFVHYSGWSKLWDEWIPESRMLKYNEQNLAKQQELKRLHERGRKGLKRKGGDESGEGSRDPSRESSRERSKRRRIKYKGHNEQDTMEPVVVVIPEAMKLKLIQDAEMIASKKLVSLPASPTVSEILDEYCEHMSKMNPASSSTGVARECTLGVKAYFNEVLSTHLLFSFERLQYDKVHTLFVCSLIL
jgi:mortality factor 4-like protein 1